MSWSEKEIPSQNGKLAIVTGGTDGIGFFAALELTRASSSVIITGDKVDKGHAAVARIRDSVPRANVEYRQVDMSSLDSVRAFAASLTAIDLPIDLLLNNAGVGGVEKRRVTPDGFELMFETNYLSHFVLTSLLLPLLQRAPEARIVSTSSLTHKTAKLNFDDLQMASDYSSDKAYAQSKLCMLLFARELDRRLKNASISTVSSLAAHPGGSRTNIHAHGRELSGRTSLSLGDLVVKAAIALIGQSAHAGALPLLYAATSPSASGGHYYGPQGFMEVRGTPGVAKVRGCARDSTLATRLWDISESLSGTRFELSSAAHSFGRGAPPPSTERSRSFEPVQT